MSLTRGHVVAVVIGLGVLLTGCTSTANSQVMLPQPPASPADVPLTKTVVSLTFDDALDDQFSNARPALRAHGMHGTFYVNSGRLGTQGFMTNAHLAAVATDGNEIGGHTTTHADLPTMSPDVQKIEICNDRKALTSLGFTVTDFAYPYGNSNVTALHSVQECGYNSARTVGGLACATCSPSAPFGTAPFLIPTPASVKTDTSLEDLERYVTDAERHGGWLPLVFHHVCDNCLDPGTIPVARFNAFLDWLGARAAHGTTVRTVSQVIRGKANPVVQGPPSPRRVQNPSMTAFSTGGIQEGDPISGLPGCFQISGYGGNTFTAARVVSGRNGGHAEQIKITQYDSGARSVLTRQDAGACAPSVTPGRSYRLSAWYTGDWTHSQAQLTVWYLTATAGWKFWTTLNNLPASSRWREASIITPAIPAEATNVSFGLSLTGVGTLTATDYDLTEATP